MQVVPQQNRKSTNRIALFIEETESGAIRMEGPFERGGMLSGAQRIEVMLQFGKCQTSEISARLERT